MSDSRLDILTNALVGPLRAGEPGACRPSRLCERDDCERAVSPYGSCSAWPEFIAAKISGAAMEYADFQKRVRPWMVACFGEEISSDKVERNHRFLEEALELVQASGCTREEAHQLVDYTFSRPTGEPTQEVGGVMVTLAALCLAHGMDMHAAGETELARIWTAVEKIRAKQAAKPRHSPLPQTIHGRDPQERIDELLRSNNELLERARKAEADVALVRGEIAAMGERIVAREFSTADVETMARAAFNASLEAVRSAMPDGFTLRTWDELPPGSYERPLYRTMMSVACQSLCTVEPDPQP